MGLDLTMTAAFESPAKPLGRNTNTAASLQSPTRRQSGRLQDSPAAKASNSNSNGGKMGRSVSVGSDAQKKSPRMFEAIEREIKSQSPWRSPRRS